MNRLTFILLAVIVLTGCGNNKNNVKATADKEMMEKAMVGAFGEQREISDEEMEMFRKATAADSLIVYTPLSVSTQVVAGINYKFWCRFEDISDGILRKVSDGTDKYGYCWITVFKPLPGRGEPQVTSIDKEGASK